MDAWSWPSAGVVIAGYDAIMRAQSRPRTACRRIGGCVFARYGWCEGCREETCFHWWLDGRCYWCRIPAPGSGVTLTASKSTEQP